MRISGLLSFSVYSSREYDRQIVLLGERHTFAGRCNDTNPTTISAHKYVLNLLDSNKNTRIDFFDEEIRSKSSPNTVFTYPDVLIDEKLDSVRFYAQEPAGYLSQLHREIYALGCHNGPLASGCPYSKNVRFHYIDTRNMNYDIQQYFDIILGWQLTKAEKRSTLITRRSEFSKYNTSIAIVEALKTLFVDLRIRLQITAIPYQKVQTHLQNLCQGLLDRDYAEYTYERVLTTISSETSELSKSDISANIMDIYTLARVFRKFPHKSNRTINGPIQNVIIYAGDFHINAYQKSLVELGFTAEYTVRNSNYEDICLQIDYQSKTSPDVTATKVSHNPNSVTLQMASSLNVSTPRPATNISPTSSPDTKTVASVLGPRLRLHATGTTVSQPAVTHSKPFVQNWNAEINTAAAAAVGPGTIPFVERAAAAAQADRVEATERTTAAARLKAEQVAAAQAEGERAEATERTAAQAGRVVAAYLVAHNPNTKQANQFYYFDADDATYNVDRCDVAVLFQGQYSYRRCTNPVADGNAHCVAHPGTEKVFVDSVARIIKYKS